MYNVKVTVSPPKKNYSCCHVISHNIFYYITKLYGNVRDVSFKSLEVNFFWIILKASDFTSMEPLRIYIVKAKWLMAFEKIIAVYF
jgi:hypothetical protein